MATDPVCGCEVVEVRPGNSAGYRGEIFVFCSQSCLDEFKKDPESYSLDAPSGRERGEQRERGGGEPEARSESAGLDIPVRAPGEKKASGIKGGCGTEGMDRRMEERAGEAREKSEKWWDRVVDWFRERV